MCEREFIEEMAKTRNGSITEEESKREWAYLRADHRNKRDKKGPRGTTRMKIGIGEYESSFSEMADEELVEAAEGAKKKQTAETSADAGRRLLTQGSTSLFLGRSEG